MRVVRLGSRIVRTLALRLFRRNPPAVVTGQPETPRGLARISSRLALARALESYPSAADQTLAADLAMRVQIEP